MEEYAVIKVMNEDYSSGKVNVIMRTVLDVGLQSLENISKKGGILKPLQAEIFFNAKGVLSGEEGTEFYINPVALAILNDNNIGLKIIRNISALPEGFGQLASTPYYT